MRKILSNTMCSVKVPDNIILNRILKRHCREQNFELKHEVTNRIHCISPIYKRNEKSDQYSIHLKLK